MRITSILLSSLLVCSVSACGGEDDGMNGSLGNGANGGGGNGGGGNGGGGNGGGGGGGGNTVAELQADLCDATCTFLERCIPVGAPVDCRSTCQSDPDIEVGQVSSACESAIRTSRTASRTLTATQQG